jgi:hypothetical protein
VHIERKLTVQMQLMVQMQMQLKKLHQHIHNISRVWLVQLERKLTVQMQMQLKKLHQHVRPPRLVCSSSLLQESKKSIGTSDRSSKLYFIVNVDSCSFIRLSVVASCISEGEPIPLAAERGFAPALRSAAADELFAFFEHARARVVRPTPQKGQRYHKLQAHPPCCPRQRRQSLKAVFRVLSFTNMENTTRSRDEIRGLWAGCRLFRFQRQQFLRFGRSYMGVVVLALE